jgi:hypothetical protein
MCAETYTRQGVIIIKFYKICFVYKSYIMDRLLICPPDASSQAMWRHVQWVYRQG